MNGEHFLSAPVILNWALTNRCNFSCRHCYSRTESTAELGTETACALLRKAARAEVLSVNFGGGEPLLRKDLLEIIRLSRSLGLAVSMNSNGFLIDAERARALKDAGINKVGISIDSPDEAAHDTFRGVIGSHKRALFALNALREAGIETTVSTVICRINANQIEPLRDLAINAGASAINFHDFKCSGLGFANRGTLDLGPAEWRAFYSEAIALRQRTREIRVLVEDPVVAALGREGGESWIKGSVCGKLSLSVKPNGDITPCGFIPIVIGNLTRDDLKEVWRTSEVLAAMREKQAKGKCIACPHYSDCLGGCSARALAVTGDLNNPDPHCWFNEAR